MRRIELNAYAKINLSIDVIGRRPDGYHDVVMVLQQIDLCDAVTVGCAAGETGGSIHLAADSEAVPSGRENIAWRAAQLMKEAFPDKSRDTIHIYIKKNIPMAAGLAGGSADAAAVLHGLNALWECGLSVSELMEIGVKLGADVPFCIMAQAAKDKRLGFAEDEVSTCALARGIGEKLAPLPSLKAFAVLLKPDISVSTADIYGSLDMDTIEKRPDTDRLIDGLKERDFDSIKAAMYNVLEEVSSKKYPVIKEAESLLQSAAPGAKIMMSGSGPSVFALTPDEKLAATAFNAIKEKGSTSFLVNTCR